MPDGEVMRYADAAMYRSTAMPGKGMKPGHIRPTVTLLNATTDPLGNLGAVMGIYEGKVFRSLAEVDDDYRRHAWEQMQKTELKGPLECITFSFLIEGVTRSWTHQAVRERQAFFAQESLRFAVVDGEPWAERASMPATLRMTEDKGGPLHERILAGMPESIWRQAMEDAQQRYEQLIQLGVSAEDARGVMPHDMTTRLHMVLNVRSLLHLAGLRLCTQAQFEWRVVLAEMVKAVRGYANRTEGLPDGWTIGGPDAWQFELIADSLRPVCYQTGHCGFMSQFDRGCSIRQRVDANAKKGRPSSEWDTDLEVTRCGADSDCPGGCSMEETVTVIQAINPAEWAADPYAARRNNG